MKTISSILGMIALIVAFKIGTALGFAPTWTLAAILAVMLIAWLLKLLGKGTGKLMNAVADRIEKNRS